MAGRPRPFRVEVPDEQLEDLRRRLRATRWPDAETVDDWSQGIPLAEVRDLATYWLDAYDWRACEARLNAVPQVLVEVDGLDVHALHARSAEPGAVPLLLTHGWPGSVVELLDLVAPLTDPVAHGGEAGDAFHVVAPSLPGYGFSQRPTEPGWGVERIADAWTELMGALGYERWVAHGGDWGSIVTTLLGVRHPTACRGIHLTMPMVVPSTTEDLTPTEQQALTDYRRFRREGSSYGWQQATKPQTLGYGLADSPVGQLAWIAEKLHAWVDEDDPDAPAVDRDALLDDVMLYWLTNTATSSARLYWESWFDPPREVPDVPVGVSIFPHDIMRTSERWARAHFGERLVHFREMERGGHFPGLEAPDLLVRELRDWARPLRDGAA